MTRINFHKQLSQNLKLMKQELHNTDDLVIREFTISIKNHPEQEGALLFLDGMASGEKINSELLRPILLDARRIDEPIDANLLIFFRESLLPAGEVTQTDNFEEALLAIMSDEVILLIDGITETLTLDT